MSAPRRVARLTPIDITSLIRTIRREYRVAFSQRGQPFGLRLAKWGLFGAVAAALYGSNFFWLWAGGLPFLGMGVHFFYRWKTGGWTRAWGGWSELDFDDHRPTR